MIGVPRAEWKSRKGELLDHCKAESPEGLVVDNESKCPVSGKRRYASELACCSRAISCAASSNFTGGWTKGSIFCFSRFTARTSVSKGPFQDNQTALRASQWPGDAAAPIDNAARDSCGSSCLPPRGNRARRPRPHSRSCP